MIRRVRRSVLLLVVVGILVWIACATVQAKQQELVVKMFSTDLYDWHVIESAKFMKEHPDIKITVEMVTGGWTKMQEVITLGILAGDQPDIIDNPSRIYYQWADKGLLVDLLPLMAKSEVANPEFFLPGLINTKLYKGQLFSAPTHFDPPTTVFQAKWFDEAGLQDPYNMYKAKTWCWETGLNAAKKLQQVGPDGKVTRWGWIMAHSNDWSWNSYITTNGGSILSDDMTTATLTSAPVISALNWMSEVYNMYKVGTYKASWNAIAIATRGGTAAERVGDNRMQTAPIAPAVAGGPAAGIVFSDGPVIFKKGDNLEAAWAYVEWLMKADSVRSLANVNPGRIPGRKDILPEWAEIASRQWGFPTSDIPGVLSMYADIASHTKLLPFGLHYPEMMDVVNPAVKSILEGKSAALTKMQEIQPVVQSILDTYYKR